MENIELVGETARNKNIRIENNVKYGDTIIADRNMLYTIIRNLLSNAIKYTHPEGVIKIDKQKIKDMTQLSISDTGVGMTVDEMELLFQVESIYSTSGTANEKGTGLGLLLCKEFVEKHSGEICVKSQKNKGTCFQISFPNKVNHLKK